ncbi:MAG: tetraacyldisaccharide 4'-kinase, partial [Pseudomonadota bacterium]
MPTCTGCSSVTKVEAEIDLMARSGPPTQSAQSTLNRLWYGNSTASLLLLPLSLVYRLVTAVRRWMFRFELLKSLPLGVPVIVVGNLTVGGTGKTPLTIWLVDALRARGFQPGVVSRGYEGAVGAAPLPVLPHSDPATVGDEPVLIAERCACPVVVHPDRVAAGQLLLDQGVDVIVADDGLQHYRLQRDLELCVVDGERGFGNGFLLPAGPLR